MSRTDSTPSAAQRQGNRLVGQGKAPDKIPASGSAAKIEQRCRHKFYVSGLCRQQVCMKPKGHNGRCASLHAVEVVRG